MMVWLPPPSALVVKLACPPDTVPVPSSFVPSKNCTVPVGDGAPEAPPLVLICAVKVTACPRDEGFRLLLSVKDVLDGVDCVTTPDVLPLKFVSPEYTAVNEPKGAGIVATPD